MKNKVLDEILKIEHFIIEQDTDVDNINVYIRPLYVELIALYPILQRKLVYELSREIELLKPEVLFTIESSILPIASLITDILEIPLSIIRKPYNYKHEKDEPQFFFNNSFRDAPAVLLDDAIWSGYSINYAFDLLLENNISLPRCYFIFDFLDFNRGGCRLNSKYYAHLKNRSYWMSYKDIIERAYFNELISTRTYEKTMLLFNDV